MPLSADKPFDAKVYLSTEGHGRRLVHLKPQAVFFSQGGPANCVYYLQSGRAKLTVVSQGGKEATITMLVPGDFIGEEAVDENHHARLANASTLSACVAMRIERSEMQRVLAAEREFSHLFVQFLLTRGMRTQADLVDQLFNSSEKRLARTLLLMADFGSTNKPESMIPEITQEALAEMIGTTRSRVSFFMNRFRKLGYIDYNGRIHVKKSLLSVVLHDQLPEQNSTRPVVVESTDPKAAAIRKANPEQGEKSHKSV